MANDSSLGSAGAFDFDSQSGVMHVLSSVRASTLSAAQKNELRDLIFLYSNGGRDQTVRNNLQQKLAQYAVSAIAKPKSFTPSKVHEFGTSRPSPAFNANPIKVSETKPEAKPAPAPAPEPAKNTPEVKSTPVEETARQSVPADIPANLPQENAARASEITKQPEKVIPQDSPAPQSQEVSLQRIKEIKSLVNEKVGNPVNLVDINNEVGREYMGALLDAMKKINGGSSAASAMQRLESAYVKVEEAILNHDKTESSLDQAKPAVSEEAVNSTPVPIQTEVAEVEPAQKAPRFSPISAKQSAGAPEPVMDTRPIVPLAQSEQPSVQKYTPIATEEPTAPVQSSVAQTEPAPEPGSAWGPETDIVTQVSAQDVTVAPPENHQQVAAPAKYQSATLAQSETKLRTPEDLPTASALETSSVAGDPLYTKQVDDGLNQLLSDWVLFKKSGLFGTGPKGSSHPLYLKIKDLQIPLLLAGRFEGATQEIKQSVTDYMNGWRYEQGIIYEQGETFDHYLRRVIRHILDLQKKG